MRPNSLLSACVLFCSAGAPCASGQHLPTFAVGDTLRVHAPGIGLRRARVSFVAWDSVTLRLRRGPADTTVVVPFSEVMRLDWHDGKNRLQGALRGAGIFGTIGMLAGLWMGKSAVAGCREFLCEMDAFGYLAAGMLAGVAIGLPVGASALAPDRWRRMELPVALGFPAYRQPFHETVTFRVIWLVGAALVSLAVN